ncbi:hypothetical protein CLAFUW4_13078 [Fulvia fulva]|uniref:RING-type E3 ubiquitin transferase n=1 Tax=Passalora fulva TaxID=5499 RepID=A0A9Q8PJ88_PASFU|nr:uncharacterized protein CLAFUR5_12936 [Fulvia fulva]KAK4612193.1 hypothetical protein CLAFUR4_13082 [Fulvia fulva]KAK4612940.1 hypothetical protein CLAFUR0_13086 [Fulvia fulva]UJO23404.1 hypothetical protein CLAFUR5_12936 [Fulvia fulva]WPV21430.1 hypothetical protein CLAFUW4_13078 [Fulvia fulva]WPV35776.1 hypothetical protein CLAFUW7_13085 [Fulvia fulva]
MESDRLNSTPNDGYKIKGAANRAHTQDACTICLETISERAVAVPCNHLTFDYLCLVSWLQEQSTCPLCKAKVTEVQYDWRSPSDFKTYPVPEAESVKATPDRSDSRHQRYYRGLPVPQRSRSTRPRLNSASSTDDSLTRRRHIYRNRLYSLHVGANRISQYREFTAQTFAASAELQSRARMFLRRELQVFTFLDHAPRGGNRDFMIECIVAILRNNELRGADGKVEELVKDFLGLENTRQLLHELEAWLRSPHTSLQDWDRWVQYADDGERRTSKR